MLQRAIELLRELYAAENDPHWASRLYSFLAEYDAARIQQSQDELAHAEFIRELARQTPPHAAVL